MQKKINICHAIIGLICCLLWLSAPPGFAEQKNAFVRTTIKLVEPVYAGQKIPFYVTLYSETRFTGAPRFELPQVSGLIIMEIEDRPVLGVVKETDGEYLTKTHEFAAFPQKDGPISIPSFTVSFAYMDVSTGKAVEKTYKTNEIQLDVTRPPGTQSIDHLISTREFKFQVAWDPKPETPRVGDAFKLTITRAASDIPGMVFLPVMPDKIKGLGVYQNPPSVQDHMERGEFSGKRIDAITYVCEEEGRFEIPGRTFYWFDLEKKELKKESLEPVVLKVAPNPQHTNELLPGDNKGLFFSLLSPQVAGVIIGIGLVCLGLFISRKTIALKYSVWKQRRAVSEKTFFKAFEKACQSNDDQKTLQALFNWLDRLVPGSRTLSVKGLFKSFHDPEILTTFNVLEKRVYGAPDQLRGTPTRLSPKLLRLARQYRKHHLKKQRSHQVKNTGLKPLNP